MEAESIDPLGTWHQLAMLQIAGAILRANPQADPTPIGHSHMKGTKVTGHTTGNTGIGKNIMRPDNLLIIPLTIVPDHMTGNKGIGNTTMRTGDPHIGPSTTDPNHMQVITMATTETTNHRHQTKS
jgi:hypothetical protein